MERSVYRRFVDWLRLRWTVFSYNFGWPDYVFLFDGWVARCALAVPILGYLILFNDSVSQHLLFDNLASEKTLPFGLTAFARLKFLYFGLIFLGLSTIVYRLFRPFVMRIATNEFDYVEKALIHFTVSSYIQIHGQIRHEGHHTLHGKYYDAEYDTFLEKALGKRVGERDRDQRTADWTGAKSQFEGLLRSMLIEHFSRYAVKRRVALTICLLFALLGYALLLIPSADLFIKVLWVTLK